MSPSLDESVKRVGDFRVSPGASGAGVFTLNIKSSDRNGLLVVDIKSDERSAYRRRNIWAGPRHSVHNPAYIVHGYSGGVRICVMKNRAR